MRTNVIRSLIIGLVVAALSMLSSACARTSDVKITIAPVGPGTPAPQVLTLGEAQVQLNEKQFLNVVSRQDASNLVGFQVAAPSFIPDSFSAGTFSVMAQPVKSVQQSFAQEGNSGAMFTLIQAAQSLGALQGSQPTQINGKPAEKLAFFSQNKLILAWSDGKRFYQIAGILAGSLDETTLVNIAASVGVH